MTLLEQTIGIVKTDPFKVGITSSISSAGLGIWTLLTSQETIRFLTVISLLLGIILTVMSIYHQQIKHKKDKR